MPSGFMVFSSPFLVCIHEPWPESHSSLDCHHAIGLSRSHIGDLEASSRLPNAPFLETLRLRVYIISSPSSFTPFLFVVDISNELSLVFGVSPREDNDLPFLNEFQDFFLNPVS